MFRSFCYDMYACQLWSSYYQYSLKHVRIISITLIEYYMAFHVGSVLVKHRLLITFIPLTLYCVKMLPALWRDVVSLRIFDNCLDEFKCFPRVSVLCALLGLVVACWCSVPFGCCVFHCLFFGLLLKLLFLFLCAVLSCFFFVLYNLWLLCFVLSMG